MTDDEKAARLAVMSTPDLLELAASIIEMDGKALERFATHVNTNVDGLINAHLATALRARISSISRAPGVGL